MSGGKCSWHSLEPTQEAVLWFTELRKTTTETHLQPHIVVEQGIGLALVEKGVQVWLQRVRLQQPGKQVAARKVLWCVGGVFEQEGGFSQQLKSL